jgi:glycosyltransferase involved in cell wall biosynthesis
MKPSVLLFEPLFRGHHGIYVRWIIRGAIQRGYRVVLATARETANHPLFPILVAEFGADLEVHFLPEYKESMATTPRSLMVMDFRFYQLSGVAYRAVSRTMPPAYVMLPYLDYCLYSLAAMGSPFGKTPWGGIAMGPSFHLRSMGIQAPLAYGEWIKERLFFHLLRQPTLAKLFVLDEKLASYIKTATPEWSARCSYLPDPAEMKGSLSKLAARQALGIPADVPVILVYGAIGLRKGFDVLLMAMQELEFPPEAHVIVAGRQDIEAKRFLASPPAQIWLHAGRLHSLDAFLSDDDEYRVFVASDLLWMGYRQHSAMSGLMVQAGQMGLPMIGCEDGRIGEEIRSKDLGITVPIHKPSLVADAIGQLVRNPHRMLEHGRNGKRAYSAHTPEVFAGVIFDGLLGWRSPLSGSK